MNNQTQTTPLSSPEYERERYIEEIIQDVESDFEARRKERLAYERQWELNMNFLNGNQYCNVDSRGQIYEDGKAFYWQNRGVFNHIAPIIDTRISKFSSVQPTISVRPETDDDSDVTAANLAEKLLENAFKKTQIHEVVRKVNVWSETCGTGFYKVIWNAEGGNQLGTFNEVNVFEGEVEVIPVSPFEIFPSSLSAQNVKDCDSIIHAKAMTCRAVKEKYGVTLNGDKVNILNFSTDNACGGANANLLDDAVIVIERYEKPSAKYPLGRLITVAGGKLLYVGDLPYINGENGTRTYPFIKQVSFSQAGCFFGTSIIERLIPVQRAFNAVKNRKHELMNRLSTGVLTVEDGSIDVDELAEEGLSPGKVLVYRQGSRAPEMFGDSTIPSDFNEEEKKLLDEFVIISGVSNVTSSSSNATLSSGTSLEILVEQDNSRLLIAAEEIRRCYVDISKHILRLYAQFSQGMRAIKAQDEFNKTRILYVDKRAFSCDDVYVESENELLYTPRQKKAMILELYSSGLLSDDNGNVRSSVKEKVLALLGYKDLDYQKGITRLQEEKAQRENVKLKSQSLEIEDIDDDKVHVDEHVRFVLSEDMDLSDQQKQNFYLHIGAHKQRIKQINGEK